MAEWHTPIPDLTVAEELIHGNRENADIIALLKMMMHLHATKDHIDNVLLI